jgi:hypothetical protein
MDSKHELFQLEYNDTELREKLRDWVCLQPEIPREKVTDCVISSFHFIDIIKDRTIAEEYATHLTKHNLTGVTEDAILNELYKYIKKTATFYEHDYDKSKKKPYKKWVDILNTELKPKHITILFLKDTITGHAINVYKDENNVLYLIDSQQHTVIPSDNNTDKEEEIYDYFEDNDFVKMVLIFIPTDNSLKRKHDDTLKIRKRSPSEKNTPKRTTRRSPTPISTTNNMAISPKIPTSGNPLKRKRDDTLKIRKQKSYEKSTLKRTKRRSPTPVSTISSMDID